MSIDVVQDVLQDSRSKGPARLALIVLAEAASKDGVCWLTQNEIAKRMNRAERNAQKAIGTVDPDELEILKGHYGQKRRNVYRVRTASTLALAVDYSRISE